MTKEELNFKKLFKSAACLSAPWLYKIPAAIRKETILKIKNELLDQGLEDLTAECPNRFVCTKKNTCVGRKLPYASPTALPYLKQLEQTNKVVDEHFYVEGCSNCPIAQTCSKTCYMVNDYVQRHKTTEVFLNYRDNLEVINVLEIETILDVMGEKEENLEVPYDCLSEKNLEVLNSYLFLQRDFKSTAANCGLANGAAAKKMLYYSMNRLAEFANMRKFVAEGKGKLTFVQLKILELVYLENKSLTEVARIQGVTKQSIGQTIEKVIKNNNIKIPRFVRKKGTKMIYNVPLLFKE
jgi:hypothetical protein